MINIDTILRKLPNTIQMYLHRHITDVAESHAMGCGEKEGDERYIEEGIGEDCPKN